MSWSYQPSLDGLRTVAVYLVLLFHAGIPAADGGFIGVDLFFVLSGFLVSNVILSEIHQSGTLRIGQFYARRVRRLLPAAVVAIAATSLVFLLIASIARRLPMVADAQSALLYFANWRFLSQTNDYFAAGVEGSPFLHFWSLSVEEQFYLFFPLLLLGLSKVSRRRSWVLLAGLVTLGVLSVAAQLYWAQVDTSHAYYGTDARLYQLLVGAVLAVVLRRPHRTVAPRVGRLAAVAGLGGLLLFASGLLELTPSARGLGAAVVSTVLIAGLMLGADGPIARVLSRPVPVFLGRISYGTYLWHWPVILVLEKVLTVDPWVVAGIAAAVGTSLAALSYEILEMPIRRSRLLARFHWKTAVVGVATSALVAVMVIPSVLEQDRMPALTTSDVGPGNQIASVAAHTLKNKPQDIDWKELDKDGLLHAQTCPADDVSGCIVVKGSGPHVAVVGDSYALMLEEMFEKMARKHGFTLSMNALPGCMWQEGLVNTRRPKRDQEACAKARVGWYETALPKLRPDVLILVTRPYDGAGWEDHIKWRDGRDQPLHEMTLAATREALTKLEKMVPRVVLTESITVPDTFDPLDCLSSSEDPLRCAVPVATHTTPTDAFYITAATGSGSVSALDLNPAFCPDAPICSPIVNGEVVWLNEQHLRPKYAAARSAEAWDLIEQAGLVDGFE